MSPVLHYVQMVDKHPFQTSPDSSLHLGVQVEGGAEVVQPEVSEVVNLAEEENQTPGPTLARPFHGRLQRRLSRGRTKL